MQQSVAEFNFSGINFSGKVGGNKEGRMQRHGGGGHNKREINGEREARMMVGAMRGGLVEQTGEFNFSGNFSGAKGTQERGSQRRSGNGEGGGGQRPAMQPRQWHSGNERNGKEGG